jgi:Zn-dependent M28 family amino/carboxypeptidase
MRKTTLLVGLSAALSVTLMAQAPVGQQSPDERVASFPEIEIALKNITSEGLLRHIKVLASDEFEGRAPGTRGEALTVQYLIEQFKNMGLKAGNPDGTYLQKVPIVGITSHSTASFVTHGKKIDLKFPEDYVAISPRVESKIALNESELVFVGYGIVAPEYDWDDYKGIDVRGKTILALAGEPQIPDPSDPTKLDEKMFKGRGLTRHYLWKDKGEIAAQNGAAAMIIIHENPLGTSSFGNLAAELSRELFYLKTSQGKSRSIAALSFITPDAARRLISTTGREMESLRRAALNKSFRPVPLEIQASFQIENKLREFESRNVIALCEGADPKFRNEYVLYTAHWDHVGRDEKLSGDQIFNGAVDNASGVAGLLEIAQTYLKMKPAPKRSILFLATTAEEAGLLGAKFYTSQPLYPFSRTLAAINMDGLFPFGRTKDITNMTEGYTTLDELLREAAAAQGRAIRRDFFQQTGFLYKSDHFEFAKAGIPIIFTFSGLEAIGKPAGYMLRNLSEFNSKHYHTVSDEVRPDWDLSGAAEDVRLLFMVGYRTAQADRYTEWKPGVEFKR